VTARDQKKARYEASNYCNYFYSVERTGKSPFDKFDNGLSNAYKKISTSRTHEFATSFDPGLGGEKMPHTTKRLSRETGKCHQWIVQDTRAERLGCVVLAKRDVFNTDFLEWLSNRDYGDSPIEGRRKLLPRDLGSRESIHLASP